MSRKTKAVIARKVANTLFLGTEDKASISTQLLKLATGSVLLVKNPRASKVLSVGSVAINLYSMGYQIFRDYKNATLPPTYAIEVTDPIVNSALLDHIKTHLVDADIVRMNTRWSSDDGKRTPDFSYEVTSSFNIDLELAGCEVVVKNPNRPAQQQQGASEYQGRSTKHPLTEIHCKSVDDRDTVSKFLRELVVDYAKETPSFYVNARWNGFEELSGIPVRPKESVILKEGQMEGILDGVQAFLDAEEHYVRLGIPYRMGMLLSGNPGSGKSSTASALAYELGLDVYFISLSSIKSDDSLISVMEDIPPRSMLILEDVDIAKATKDRTEKGEGVTMQGLLNCLDGFTSPHGVITVMTTNHKESLDPAIIRPGRVDLEVEINELNTYQLTRLCEYFIGYVPEDLPEVKVEDGITSADIVGVIKGFIPNPEDSGPAIVEFVKSRTGVFTK